MAQDRDRPVFTEFLPRALRTRQIEAFARNVVDHAFRKQDVRRVGGWIGDYPPNHDPEFDVYLDFMFAEHEAEAGRPAFVLLDPLTTAPTEVRFFHEMLNVVAGGARSAVAADIYTWQPPIDLDKFVNPGSWVWVVDGLEPWEISAATDLRNDVVGKVTATVATDDGPLVLSSGHAIRPRNDADPDLNDRIWIVEGVGRSIVLVPWVGEELCAWNVGTWGLGCPWSPTTNTDYLQPDYVTIERGCADANDWSKSNRWFHRDVIKSWENLSYVAAAAPIIEFERDIELWNHGTKWRTSVDIVVDDCDAFFSLVSALDPADAASYLSIWQAAIDQGCTVLEFDPGDTIWEFASRGWSDVNLGGTRLVDGLRILAIGPDPWGNRIYTVRGIADFGRILLITDTSGDDPTGAPVAGETVDTTDADGFRTMWWFDGTTWKPAQNKVSRSQPPLFRLFDADGVPLEDPGSRPGSDFAGNRIFAFREDTDGEVDEATNIRLSFNQHGAIEFEWATETDRATWQDASGKRVEIPGYYWWHRTGLSGDPEVYANGWWKPVGKVPLERIERLSVIEGSNTFELAAPPVTPTDDPDLPVRRTIEVRLDGKVLTEGTDWTVSGSVLTVDPTLLAASTFGFVEVVYRPDSDPEPDLGAWLPPWSWTNNPLNAQPKVLGYNDLYEHMRAGIAGTDGLVGEPVGRNNWRDTSRPRVYGSRIFQHDSPWFLAVGTEMAVPGGTDAVLRRSETQWEDYARSIVDTAMRLYRDGRLDTTVPWSEWVDAAVAEYARTRSKVFPWHDSTFVRNVSYAPLSAAALGFVAPADPQIVTETFGTLSSSWIEGHDGSRIPVAGDESDQVRLQLELDAFATLDPVLQTENPPVPDLAELLPGAFRQGVTGRDELNAELEPLFVATVLAVGLADPWENRTWRQDEPFSWNWRTAPSFDGSVLPGYWRGIYRWYFDTDRPDLRPWEMLGFRRMPSWWIDEYGPPPWTSANTALWTDLENGIIRQGPRAGTWPQYARPGLRSILPVSETGQILDPLAAGIALAPPTPSASRAAWRFGDHGPVENAWRLSPRFPFVLVRVLLRRAWGRIASSIWNPTGTRLVQTGWNEPVAQLVGPSLRRPEPTTVELHGTENDDGTTVVTTGLSRLIVEYARLLGNSDAEDIRSTFGNLTSRLAFAAEGFVDGSTSEIRSEIDGRIPGKTWHAIIHESPDRTIEEASAVAIFSNDDGTWSVWGWSPEYRWFDTLPPDRAGPKKVISVGAVAPVVTEWEPRRFYNRGDLAVFDGVRYVATTAHVSSSTFATDADKWVEDTRKTLARPKLTATAWRRAPAAAQPVRVAYGTRFASVQDVVEFLAGYQRWLESRGWIFDVVDDDGTVDFFRSAASFASWVVEHGQPGGVFVADPIEKQLKFRASFGYVADLSRGPAPWPLILRRDGLPLDPERWTVERDGAQVTLRVRSVPSGGGAHLVRLAVTDVQHAVVLPLFSGDSFELYIPLTGDRQPRFLANLMRVAGWQGRYEAAGFLVTGDRLIPNFERMVEGIRLAFDIDQEHRVPSLVQEYARHTVAWQDREWLSDLVVDPRTRVRFFLGMLAEKGTRAVTERLLRGRTASQVSAAVHEEWLVRTASHGGRPARLLTTVAGVEFRENPQRLVVSEIVLTDPTPPDEATAAQLVAQATANDDARIVRHFFTFEGRVVSVAPSVTDADGFPGKFDEFGPFPSVASPPPAELAPSTSGIVQPGDFDEVYADVESMWESIEAALRDGSLVNGTVIWLHDTTGLLPAQTAWPVSWSLFQVRRFTARVVAISSYTDIEGHNANWPTQPLDATRTWSKIGFSDDVAGSTGKRLEILEPGDWLLVAEGGNVAWPGENRLLVGAVLSTKEIVVRTDRMARLSRSFTEEETPFGGLYVLRELRHPSRDDWRDAFSRRRWQNLDRLGTTTTWIVHIDDDRPAALRNAVDPSPPRPAVLRVDETGSETTLRRLERVPDNRVLEAVVVRDTDSGRILHRTEPYDPLMGIVPGAITRELDYAFPSDPAIYTNGPSGTNVFADRAWGAEQKGKRWWRTGKDVRYDYRVGDPGVRRALWGVPAEGSEVECYEWVESPVPPETWATRAQSGAPGFDGTPFVPDGATTTPYTKLVRQDRATGNRVERWYFWVRGRSVVPAGRRFSVSQVERALVDPFLAGIPWCAFLDERTILFTPMPQFVARGAVDVEILWKSTAEPVHHEWKFVTIDDGTSAPDPAITGRLVDSLRGFDDDGDPVPDPALAPMHAIGHDTDVARAWFRDRIAARDAILAWFDDFLSHTLLVGSTTDWQSVFDSAEPEPAEGFDVAVSTLAERDLVLTVGLVSVGDKVLVSGEPGTANFWTVWQLDSLSPPQWTLVDWQTWKGSDFYEITDWYDESVDPDLPPVKSFADIGDRDANLSLIAPGDIVEVRDNGSGQWEWQSWDGSAFTVVARKASTIRVAEKYRLGSYLLTPKTDLTGLDAEAFAEIVSSRDGSIELGIVLDAVLSGSLFGNSVALQLLEQGFLAVLREQKSPDWLVRPSTVVIATNEVLSTDRRNATSRLVDAFIDFFAEASPFHVVVRGVRRDVSLPTDEAGVEAGDFEGGGPDDPVREIDGTILFDRVDCAEADDGHPLALVVRSNGGRTYPLAGEDVRISFVPSYLGYQVVDANGTTVWTRDSVERVEIVDRTKATTTELARSDWNIEILNGVPVLQLVASPPADADIRIQRHIGAAQRIHKLYRQATTLWTGASLSAPPPTKAEAVAAMGCAFKGEVLEGGPFLGDLTDLQATRKGLLPSLWSPTPSEIWRKDADNLLDEAAVMDLWSNFYSWGAGPWNGGASIVKIDRSGLWPDESDLVYDVTIDGGPPNWTVDTSGQALTFEGAGFARPAVDSGLPEELARARAIDPLVLDVFHGAEPGVPRVAVSRFEGNDTVGPWPWADFSQSRSSILVFRNGRVQTEGVDYTVDWAARTVTYTAPLATGDTGAVLAIGYGGLSSMVWSEIHSWSEFTANSLELDVGDAVANVLSPTTVFVTVAGYRAQVTAVSGTTITVNTGSYVPSADDDVVILVWSTPDFAAVSQETFNYAFAGQSFTLTEPVDLFRPEEAGTLVWKDGLFLRPPRIVRENVGDLRIVEDPLANDLDYAMTLPLAWQETRNVAPAVFSAAPPFAPTFVDDRIVVPLPRDSLGPDNVSVVLRTPGGIGFDSHPFDVFPFDADVPVAIPVGVLAFNALGPSSTEIVLDVATVQAVYGIWPTEGHQWSVAVAAAAKASDVEIFADTTELDPADPDYGWTLGVGNNVVYINGLPPGTQTVTAVISTGAEWTLEGNILTISNAVPPPGSIRVVTIDTPGSMGTQAVRYPPNGAGRYPIPEVPTSGDHVIVAIDGEILEWGRDYLVEPGGGGIWSWDPFSASEWNAGSPQVVVTKPHDTAQQISIVLVSGDQSSPPVAWRSFHNPVYGFEDISLGWAWRLELASSIRVDSPSILVMEANVPQPGTADNALPWSGAIWVDGDRIEYHGVYEQPPVGGRRVWELTNVRLGTRSTPGTPHERRVTTIVRGPSIWEPWHAWKDGELVLYGGTVYRALADIPEKGTFDLADWAVEAYVPTYDAFLDEPGRCLVRISVEILTWDYGVGVWQRECWACGPWNRSWWYTEDTEFHETFDYMIGTRISGGSTWYTVTLSEVVGAPAAIPDGNIRITAVLREWSCTDVVHEAGADVVVATTSAIPGGTARLLIDTLGGGMANGRGPAVTFLRATSGDLPVIRTNRP